MYCVAGAAGAVCAAVATRGLPQTATQALAAVLLLAGLQWALTHGVAAASVFGVGAARFLAAVAARARQRSAEGDTPSKGKRCAPRVPARLCNAACAPRGVRWLHGSSSAHVHSLPGGRDCSTSGAYPMVIPYGAHCTADSARVGSCRYGGYSEALQAADSDIGSGEAGLRAPAPETEGGADELRSRASAREPQGHRERFREGIKGFGRLVADNWKARSQALPRCRRRCEHLCTKPCLPKHGLWGFNLACRPRCAGLAATAASPAQDTQRRMQGTLSPGAGDERGALSPAGGSREAVDAAAEGDASGRSPLSGRCGLTGRCG